ncbi:MAG: HAMP domain-containing protein [Luteitalea sp.]|nr:HAMP domain-containing protein [Luteitalea sp.]
MTTLTQRFVMLVATAAVAPLLLFGIVAIWSLDTRTRESAVLANQETARRAAEEIGSYLSQNMKMLQAVAADLQHTRLDHWQRERILRNYVLAFPEVREITLFDVNGRVLATSRLGETALQPQTSEVTSLGGVLVSPIEVDDDLLPRSTMTLPLRGQGDRAGMLVADLTLEELWRLVDRIRIGDQGFALLVDRAAKLIAHGNPDEKARIARGEYLRDHPLVAATLPNGGGPTTVEYRDAAGRELLSVAASVPQLEWIVLVDQPTAEAFAAARRLRSLLLTVVALALLTTVVVGGAWGRSFIRPIFALLRGTEALSRGRFDTHVHIARRDEFRTLGDAFNSMADRLLELQRKTIRQERQAMFGRIAAGLAHDLSHPLHNIKNNCKLILKLHTDTDYRGLFDRTVSREFGTIQRIVEDLRNIARPIPLERFPLDVNRSILDVVERMRAPQQAAGVDIELDLADDEVHIEGDLFAFSRVLRNLITNALQATAPGGRVTFTSRAVDSQVEISLADTGCGIPPDRLAAIFDDFVTTKRRGLGLGLAISRKIVEQLDGTIAVASEVGKGTTFVLRFPALARQQEHLQRPVAS